MVEHSVGRGGSWEFREDERAAWRPIAVPGCWENIGVAKNHAGPAWYRARIAIPADFAGKRVWLRFGGVSYHCVVLVNGHEVATHTGLWDAFTCEITNAVAPGQEAKLLLQVEKPASLREGPASEALPGRFPLKQTLAGFLPYVWGHIFGGVWQDVTLRATGPAAFARVSLRGFADGRVQIEADHDGAGPVGVTICGPDGRELLAVELQSDGALRHEFVLAEPQPWSPERPALYSATLRLGRDDSHALRFGLRTVAVDGATLLLNDRPVYPRMALSWGWYPEALHSNPGPERVRADLLKLRSLGYNGVKLCLWFPPQYYFDLADELGMLLWVELPMWLPEPTPFFREQTPGEYERLVRQSRDHPSVILYSLGCELNRAVGPDILGPLFAAVKRLAGDALVRDNSGSGEAYGGLLREFAEFYDYHFYGELPFFQQLLDYFSPRWRPEQPWVFGEFCDYDTFRDLRGLQGAESSLQLEAADQHAINTLQSNPWWTSADPAVNPQGARWQFDLPFQEQRLRAGGLWERGDELRRLSEQHGLLHRKWTIEMVRTYREIGGYVITGEADTPISTAGMWDDAGRLKFDPAAFRGFNNDTVLLVGWDKRRAWVAGGDRAAFWDTWSYPGGALVRPHLITSHYGPSGAARLAWQVALAGQEPFASGELAGDLAPGAVRELAVAEFEAPAVGAPQRGLLSAELSLGGETVRNSWPLWFFPAEPWKQARGVALYDPAGRLHDLPKLAPHLTPFAEEPAAVVIATSWSPEVEAFVRRGGRAILLQPGRGPHGPLPTVELPFWREALRLCEPHPAWGDFPHDGWAELQFFGCATDHALDAAGQHTRPILRRVDTRTMAVHDYACELQLGSGALIASTLRFEGGQGAQPLGIARNTAAAYLLRCWTRYLQTGGSV